MLFAKEQARTLILGVPAQFAKVEEKIKLQANIWLVVIVVGQAKKKGQA